MGPFPKRRTPAAAPVTGVLYLVATPIGNPDDMTLRAIHVLKNADIVVCEERKEGERLLRHFQIHKPIELLNEHNEKAATFQIIDQIRAGNAVALVSDCGTPVFSDPGRLLVEKVSELGIRIVPIPGASSLLPALTVSGFPIDRFLFYGWLSPKKERRRAELRKLREERQTIVLMDAPYRLSSLLRDLAECFGETRRVCIAFNLTLPDERIYRGTAAALHKELSAGKIKGEFVVILEKGFKGEGR